MKTIIGIACTPSVMNEWPSRDAVLAILRAETNKLELPELAPYRIITTPYPLAMSITEALLQTATEVMVETGDVNDRSLQLVNVASRLREKRQEEKLKPLAKTYSEGLPKNSYAVVILPKYLYEGKISPIISELKFGFSWPVVKSIDFPMDVTMTIQSPGKEDGYALDDLKARLQISMLQVADTTFNSKKLQNQTGDISQKAPLQPLALPPPERISLPSLPELPSVNSREIQESAAELLAAVRRLSSCLNST